MGLLEALPLLNHIYLPHQIQHEGHVVQPVHKGMSTDGRQPFFLWPVSCLLKHLSHTQSQIVFNLVSLLEWPEDMAWGFSNMDIELAKGLYY